MNCSAFEGGEVEEGGRVVLQLVLLLVLVLDLPLLGLQVKDGPSLGVVQRRRPVKGAQEKGHDQQTRCRLQTQPPAVSPKRNIVRITFSFFPT